MFILQVQGCHLEKTLKKLMSRVKLPTFLNKFEEEK